LLEPAAVTLFTRHEHVGQKLHLDAHFAFALTRFTAPARHVEGKVTRSEATGLRVLGRGEQLADRIERFQVRDGIRSWRAPDGCLIDEHDIADELVTFEPGVHADFAVPLPLGAFDRRIEDVVDQCRLAGPAHTSDASQCVERNLDVHTFEVMLARAG
jgi:hypothetical protein